MKKILSLALAGVMMFSALPVAYAAGTQDYTMGTQVSYNAEDPDGDGIVNSNETYTITVPALLAPGGSGTVTLEGTWASDRVVTVTADENVVLTNNINAADKKTLDIHFEGISKAGDNTKSQKFTETVSVANIQDALFGTWSGHFEYNVDIANTTQRHGLYYLDDSHMYETTYALDGVADIPVAFGFLKDGTMIYTMDGENQLTTTYTCDGTTILALDNEFVLTADGKSFSYTHEGTIIFTAELHIQKSIFYVRETNGYTTDFVYEPNMTWADFVADEELNINNWFKIQDGFSYFYDDNDSWLQLVDSATDEPVAATDIIESKNYYTLAQ